LALPYAEYLKKKYPRNLIYTSHYIENCIRMNQYTGLEPLIEKLRSSELNLYRYLGEIHAGYYAEMVEKNYQKAIDHYKMADKLGNKDSVRTPHYDSMLFYGMGRTYKKMGFSELAHSSLKQSVKIGRIQSLQDSLRKIAS
jgi:tetratricopeptide (TPR) repeat protein